MTNEQPIIPTPRQVPALNAWGWTVQGFYLFKENPVMWIILFLIYLAILVPVSLLPVVGSIFSALLAPVFAAGLMWGCHAVMQKQDLEINHLFLGFKKNTAQLISVGGIYLFSLLTIAVFVVLSLDTQTIDLLVNGKEFSQEQARKVVLPVLIAMLFLMPVLMAYLFAPVLVGLHNLTAVQAMKLSFKASMQNILPFLLYGLIFMGLLIAALIPYGAGLVIVMPIMMTSLYVSYTDIFQTTIKSPEI